MGGKSATTTQKVTIPPEVMARYNAVNKRAEQAAAQPFQQYSTDPNAFVAPITGTQQAGIQNIGMAQNIAQPYYQAGAGLTLSGSRGVGPLTQQQIGYYENPYTQAVAGTTFDALRQQQQQEMQGATANAIRSGAFGGDRAGLVAANLARQQQLGTAQAIAPIYERGYAQALQTAQGQQGVMAQDLQRQLAAGQQIAGLGTGATQTALQAGQALLGAGTAEQQTQQAGLSALYNQFLQERGYPFQVAQFLANIAMGTGALSGSTTTTQQPVPFLSDEREKTNIQPLGKGLYAYDYIDDVEAAERGERPMPPKRVGPMAQDIEERAPGLVGEVGGHKVVKGLAPESMGGAVIDLGPGEYRAGYAPGGLVSSEDIRAILEAQKQAFAPYAQAGLYGGSPQQGGVGKPAYVPSAMLPTPKLMTAGAPPRMPESIASQAMGTAREFGLTPKSMYEMGREGLGKLRDMGRQGPSRAEPPAPSSQEAIAASRLMPSIEWDQEYMSRYRGGLVGYADGGGVDKDDPMASYGAQGPSIGIPTEQPDIKPLEPAKPPSSQPNSVMGDILGLAKTAASIYSGLPFANGGLVPRAGYQAGGSPSFDEALERTLRYEGGYNPNDVGSPTMMGIRQASNPDVDLRRVKEDPEYRSNIYRERYWNPIGADRMDPKLATIAFDTSVNLGPGRTKQLLEEAGNDPIKLLQLRQRHYDNLIARDPEKYGQYGGGWSSRVRDLMAYAGGEPRAEASGAIDRAAGRPAGLAAARGAPSPEEGGLIASILPTKFGTKTLATPKGEQFGGLGEFLTSRQFVQPLLEGIGAMASSQSLNPWGAALQGLGAASRAYTGLEKEMAGIGETKERTGLVQAQADLERVRAQGAAIQNFEGRVNILVRDSSGRPKWIDFENDYKPNRNAYQLYIPSPGETIPDKPTRPVAPSEGVQRGDVGPQKPADQKKEEPAVGAETTAPTSTLPSRGTDPFSLTEDLQKRAVSEAAQMRGETNASLAGRQDIVSQQNKLAELAREQKKLLLEIGVLGSTPGGFVSQGPLVRYKYNLAKVANDVVGSVFPLTYDPKTGKTERSELFDSKDIANIDAWNKKLAELSDKAAMAGNQRAEAALGTLRGMFPSPELTAGGFAKNAAEVLVQRQIDIERARFVNKYHDIVRRENPSRFSERFGPAILEEFNRRYEDVFNAQQRALERMLNPSSGPTDPNTRRRMMDENGKPMSWFTFLQKNASRLDPEFVKQIENRFNAPGIMNYFQVGAP